MFSVPCLHELVFREDSHVISSYLQVVLNNATVETDNLVLCDCAYIYWRLLSTDPELCIYLFLS